MVGVSMDRASTLSLALSLTALLACGGSTPAGPSGKGSKGGSNNGSLTVKITDSPFSDAQALLVTFSQVEVRADGGGWHSIPFASGTSITCDLKKLQGPTDVLGTGTLAAGRYTQVSLVVSSASIFFDNPTTGSACSSSIAAPAGASAPIEVRSGEVKLTRDFTIASGSTTMILDFDGDQSVKQVSGTGNGTGPGGTNKKYNLNPVITVVSVQ